MLNFPDAPADGLIFNAPNGVTYQWSAASGFWSTMALTLAAGSTGDTVLTYRTTANPGWIVADDGTIGDASSGATTRANADTQPLFVLLWGVTSNTACPVLPGGRGASAAADYAAHKTLGLAKLLGRVLGTAGNGAGLTARGIGDILGEEMHILTTPEMPSHTHLHGAWGSNSTFGSLDSGANNNVALQSGGSTGGAGGGGGHNNMQPTSFLKLHIKL